MGGGIGIPRMHFRNWLQAAGGDRPVQTRGVRGDTELRAIRGCGEQRLHAEGHRAWLMKTAAPNVAKRMTLTKALVVKNAAFMRERSLGLTRVCWYTSSRATRPTPMRATTPRPLTRKRISSTIQAWV